MAKVSRGLGDAMRGEESGRGRDPPVGAGLVGGCARPATLCAMERIPPGAADRSHCGRVGVLALQGDVREHVRVLAELGADPVEVRTAGRSRRGRRAGPARAGSRRPCRCCSSPPGCSSRCGERLAARHAGLRDLRRDDPAGRRGGRRPARPAPLRRHRHRRAPQRLRPPGRLVRDRPGGRPVSTSPLHAVFIRAPVVEWVGPSVEVLARGDRHATGAPGRWCAGRDRCWSPPSTPSCRATSACTSCSWSRCPELRATAPV